MQIGENCPTIEMADEKEKACCVRGYHVYEGM